MKFVLINGPSCSGKSTIIRNILLNTDNFFYLSYDTVKWSFSKYASGKYTEHIMSLLVTILQNISDKKFNIICDSGLHKQYRDVLINKAKENNYETIMINLEADYEILKQRFQKRMEDLKENPQKRIANTSEERHRELFEMYQNEKEPTAITFRTDSSNPEDVQNVVNNILKLIS